MTNLSSISAMIGDAGASLNEFIGDNKNTLITTGVGLAGVAVGAGAATVVNRVRRKTSTTKRKSRTKTTRKRSYKSKKNKKYKYARTAGKGRDRSTKRIRMTKKGQPYIILKSGKARFIKKSSAHNSRKRKGGRY